MPRPYLLAAMLLLTFIATLATGVAWLRRTPAVPDHLRAIAPGMTVAEIEKVVGRPLACDESCTGHHYEIEVPCDLLHGRHLFLAVTTTWHGTDPVTGEHHGLAHGDEVCTRVRSEHWSRIAWVDQWDWLHTLLIPADD
jgi:hypothetical protein